MARVRCRVAAASVIANANLRYGEELMKSLSHMGVVRVPPHQAREISRTAVESSSVSIANASMIQSRKSTYWRIASPRIAAMWPTKISSSKLQFRRPETGMRSLPIREPPQRR